MDDFFVAALTILAAAPFVAGAVVLLAREWQGRELTTARAMRALGLEPPSADRAGHGAVLFEGTIDSYRVTLERVALERRLRIAVESGGRIPRGLQWGRKTQEPAALRLVPQESGRLARFLTHITPRPYQVSGIVDFFSAKERARIVSGLKSLGVEICEGELFREIGTPASAIGLARRVRNTVKLTDVIARGILPACERALASDAPRVRLEAARILEARGLPTLRALAIDAAAPPEVVVEALQSLDAANDREGFLAGLMRAVESGQGEARFFAIDALGQMQHRAAVGPLLALLPSDDVKTACAAVEALARIGDASVEPALIAALRSDSEEVRVAAATALGAIGTIAAVGPLQSVQVAWFADTLRSVLREAVARIQSRACGADTGQLALADGGVAQGALSVATTAGAVSLPEPDRDARAAAAQSPQRESDSPSSSKRSRPRRKAQRA